MTDGGGRKSGERGSGRDGEKLSEERGREKKGKKGIERGKGGQCNFRCWHDLELRGREGGRQGSSVEKGWVEKSGEGRRGQGTGRQERERDREVERKGEEGRVRG